MESPLIFSIYLNLYFLPIFPIFQFIIIVPFDISIISYFTFPIFLFVHFPTLQIFQYPLSFNIQYFSLIFYLLFHHYTLIRVIHRFVSISRTKLRKVNFKRNNRGRAGFIHLKTVINALHYNVAVNSGIHLQINGKWKLNSAAESGGTPLFQRDQIPRYD